MSTPHWHTAPVIYNIFMPQSRSHQQPQPRPCDPLRKADIEIPVHIFEAGFFKHCAKKSVRDKKTIEHIARSVLSARSTNFVWLNEHNLLERSYKEAIKDDLPKPSKKDPKANQLLRQRKVDLLLGANHAT